jgi:hypothetical protein
MTLNGMGASWAGLFGSWIYNYLCNQCLSPQIRSWQGVLDTTLCDKVCQWLAAGQWISPGTPVSSTNKTVRHAITEIFLYEEPYVAVQGKWWLGDDESVLI